MEEQVMELQMRESRGKGGARTVRRQGRLPAVVYGAHKDPVAVSADPRSVETVLKSEHGHNVILTLKIPGQGSVQAMIRDWQVDPVRGELLHVDFLRVAMGEKIRVKVAVHFVGDPVGVRTEGGLMEVILREVEVECLPGDIPEEFKVDVASLGLNQSVRVDDLKMDKVRILSDENQVLVHVIPPRAQEEEEKPEDEVVIAEGEQPAEPEVAKRGKAEEEGAEQAEQPGKKD